MAFKPLTVSSSLEDLEKLLNFVLSELVQTMSDIKTQAVQKKEVWQSKQSHSTKHS